MDAVAFQFIQEAEDEEDAIEADMYNTQLSAALLITGAEASRDLRKVERRNQTRNYLCRPQLQPNPRHNTPWQALFNSRNGAFVLCHKTRRMEWRRGMGGASVVDVLTQPVTIETEQQKRSSHTLFGHPRAFRI